MEMRKYVVFSIAKSSISEMMESKSNQNELRQKLKIAKQRKQESTCALKSFAQEGDQRNGTVARKGYGIKRRYFQRGNIKAY